MRGVFLKHTAEEESQQSGNILAERKRKAEATQLKQHYAGKLLTLHTTSIIPDMGMDIVHSSQC